MKIINSKLPTLTLWLMAALAWTVGAVSPVQADASDEAFAAYWYAGQAEITSYALEQARYGEVHQGHAVTIFVSEDFSRSKQVKLDNPLSAGDDRVPVLKLNLDKKFNTGIYPYSMMTSVFTPVADDTPQALKITTSSQEWCGHTFTQLNRLGDGYRLRELSYFESEGDFETTFESAQTEDDLWNWIRLRPESLPQGEVELIPGSMYMRFKHVAWEPRHAVASLTPDGEDAGLLVYRLDYPELRRQLAITFEKDFPHRIEGWEETYTSGWGRGAQQLTTRATRLERLNIDYWTKNRRVDEALRQQLRLP